MDFVNKVAVVTAGARGIGRACAHALANEGMRVVVADIDFETAKQTADAIIADGFVALAVQCDVTKEADVAALAATTVAHFGQVDLLHNHAGVAVAGSPEQIPMSEWQRVLEFNVLSQVRGVMHFLPHLLKSGGHVVNTTSSLGVVSGHPMAAMVAPYVTSKRAIVGLTQSLADWLRPQGVGVSLLTPDYTDTGFGESMRIWGPSQELNVSNATDARIPSASVDQPEDVAAAYIVGLREGRFLISCTPNVLHLLRTEADAGLDPAALHGVYTLKPGG